MIRSEVTSKGNSKESYEFSLSQYRPVKRLSTEQNLPQHAEYLPKLEGPLDSPAKVCEAAGLADDAPELPAVISDDDASSLRHRRRPREGHRYAELVQTSEEE